MGLVGGSRHANKYLGNARNTDGHFTQPKYQYYIDISYSSSHVVASFIINWAIWIIHPSSWGRKVAAGPVIIVKVH